MSNKRPKPEEIDSKLRLVEVLVGQGMKQIGQSGRLELLSRRFTAGVSSTAAWERTR